MKTYARFDLVYEGEKVAEIKLEVGGPDQRHLWNILKATGGEVYNKWSGP